MEASGRARGAEQGNLPGPRPPSARGPRAAKDSK